MIGELVVRDSVKGRSVEHMVRVIGILIERRSVIANVSPVPNRSTTFVAVDDVDIPATHDSVYYGARESGNGSQYRFALAKRQFIAKIRYESMRPVDIGWPLFEWAERILVTVFGDGPAELVIRLHLESSREALFEARLQGMEVGFAAVPC